MINMVQAGGNLGPTVLNTFLKQSSFNITVLSRKGSSSTFPTGVKVIHADYDSLDSLKDAFRNQDVVLSLVGASVLGDQNKIIDAAIAAGVGRFIPSEFGSNTADARTREAVPFFEAKYGTVNYLKSKESDISWTALITGVFFDWGLKVGFLGFDHASKTATIFDNGTATFGATNLHSIALALVKVLEKPDESKNQYVFVSGFQTSQKQILEAAEKIMGEKWTVNNKTARELVEGAHAKIHTGDYAAGVPMLIQGSLFGAEAELCNYESEGLWNEKLGLPKDDLEKSIRAVFDGKLAHEI
jgi:uncharacterized protein YbjT (DUF2867 family)